jgi:ABC-type Fe3+/spermidine/putrescine transport system ATPase subunit
MIAFESVTVLKGARAVLSGLDLRLPPKAFISLIGPSWGGNSTLLRTLAGLEGVQGGRVILDGKILGEPGRSLPPHERGIAMVFQDLALWPHRTVEGNLLLALALLPRAERRVRTAEALTRWGLTGMASRYPDTLSGGQRQRLALARAWALGRPVLLLDEPASALDRPAREALVADLKALQRARGLSVLYVTHQQDEALRVSDLVVVLMDGRVAQVGTRDDLMDRPASAEVSAFLGGE